MQLKLTTRLLLRLPSPVRRLGEHVAARVASGRFPELRSDTRPDHERARVALIAIWLGPPPAFLPAFLRSCETNPGFDWLIFADWSVDEIPLPPNVRLFRASRAGIVARCFRTTGLVPHLDDVNKLCDLRPHYARIFQHEVAGYEYWGFCDLDCVWGDLESAYGAPIADGVDVVTSRKEVLAGHFTVIRSGSPIEALAFDDARLRADMENPQHVWADEERFSELVREAAEAGTIRVFWPECIAGDGEFVDHTGRDLTPWVWENGRMMHAGREFSYLHFMHWKHLPGFRCSLAPGIRHASFTISPLGIESGILRSEATVDAQGPESS
jgi:hypothetical protein